MASSAGKPLADKYALTSYGVAESMAAIIPAEVQIPDVLTPFKVNLHHSASHFCRESRYSNSVVASHATVTAF